MEPSAVFFDGWSGLGRVLIVGPLAYGALVAIMRMAGNRTLAKLNAFDLVVTFALGSMLSTVILNNSVALVEGVLAISLLVLLQFIITFLSVRFAWARALVKAEPTLVFADGRFLHAAMRRQRLTEEEILSVLRGADVADADAARAVVLETDGSLSVLTARAQSDQRATLRNVNS